MSKFLNKYKDYYSELIKLGIPLVLGMLSMFVLSFFDTLMIGQYGTKELAACSFVVSIINISNVTLIGFSMGIIPLAGSYFGQNNKAKVGEILKSGIFANILFTIIVLFILFTFYLFIDKMGQPQELIKDIKSFYLIQFSALPFVAIFFTFKQFTDTITRTKISMIIIIEGNLINIILNYFLIYGKGPFPELGLNGAGYATLISKIIMVVHYAFIFGTKSWAEEYRKGYLYSKFNLKEIKKIFGLGIPTGIQMGLEGSSWTAVAIFAGWIGTVSLAAHQIIVTISFYFFMVYSGLGSSLAVCVSKYDIKTQYKKIKETGLAGTHLMLILIVTNSLLFYLLKDIIGHIFTNNIEVSSLIGIVAIPLILYQFGDGMQLTYINLLRGIGKVKNIISISIFCNIIITISAAYICGIYLKGGLYGLWFGFVPGLSTAAIFYSIKFYKTLKKSNLN